MITTTRTNPADSEARRREARRLPWAFLAFLLLVAGCSGGSRTLGGDNRAPEIRRITGGGGASVAGEDDVPTFRAPAGTSVTLACDAHDREGDPITYAWSGNGFNAAPAAGEAGSSAGGANTIAFSRTDAADTLVTCTVRDDRGSASAASVRIQTFDALVNHAPRPTFSVSPDVITPGAVVPLTASATDDDGDAITFAFFASRGTITPDPANPVQATFTAPAAPGEVTLAAVATDAKGASTAQLVRVTVKQP